MLQLRNTRLYKSLFENLASGVSIQEEGVPLTFIKENGETKVEIATAGNVFAGVALARNLPPHTLPMVETGTVPSSGAGQLTRTPIAGQLLVKIDGVAADVVSGAPAAGEVAVSGTSFEANAADAGKAISFQYHYYPSVLEARSVLGDSPYGGLSANALGTIAVVKQGEIATNFFDASADWSSTLRVAVADGQFVPAGANNAIENVLVKNTPSAGNPFLILSISIA